MKFPTASSVTDVGFWQFRITVDLKTKAYCVPQWTQNLTQQITDENFNSQFSTKAVAWAMYITAKLFGHLTAWSIVLCPWYHSVSWSRSVRYCISSPFITRHLTPPSIIFTFLDFFSDRLSTGNWTFRPLAVSPAAWTVRPLNDSPPGRFAPYMWTFRPKLTVLGISPSRRGRIQIDVLPHLRMFPSSRNGTY